MYFIMSFCFYLIILNLTISTIEGGTLLTERIVWNPVRYVDPGKEDKIIPFKIAGPGILQVRWTIEPFYCVNYPMRSDSVFKIPELWNFGWKHIRREHLYDGKPGEDYKVSSMCYLSDKIKKATFIDEYEVPAKPFSGMFVITSPLYCSFNACDRRGAAFWAEARFIAGHGQPTGTVGHVAQLPKPQSAHFDKPTYKGYRLNICRVWASDCGKGAADAFCSTKGYTHAESWEVDHDIGHISPTIVIGSEQICNQSFCDGFKFINL